MHKGQTVTSLDSKWTANIIEIRETPDGQSVKLQRVDRKVASWYWMSQVKAI